MKMLSVKMQVLSVKMLSVKHRRVKIMKKILSVKMLSVKVFSFRYLISWMSDSDYSAAIDTDTHSVINHYANNSHYGNYQIDQEIYFCHRFCNCKHTQYHTLSGQAGSENLNAKLNSEKIYDFVIYYGV